MDHLAVCVTTLGVSILSLGAVLWVFLNGDNDD